MYSLSSELNFSRVSNFDDQGLKNLACLLQINVELERKLLIKKILSKIFSQDKIHGVEDLIYHGKDIEPRSGSIQRTYPWFNYLNKNDIEFDYIPGYHMKLYHDSLYKYDCVMDTKELKDFVDRSKYRFMVIPIAIFLEIKYSKAIGHQNIIIIDKEKKLVENFDPNGKYIFSNLLYVLPYSYLSTLGKMADYSFKIDNKIIENIVKPLKYKYISSCLSGKLGPQYKQKKLDKDGFCITWSILYMHLRLRNPNMDSEDILNYLLDFTSEKLLNIIKKYETMICLNTQYDKTIEDIPFIHNTNYFSVLKSWIPIVVGIPLSLYIIGKLSKK